ncbi:hypothetical protein Gpo141_00011226 [Globisporangium polare]
MAEESAHEISPLSTADCPATSSMLPVMVSVASLVGCIYVIVTYLYVRALRQHPAGIMFGMSVYGAIYQFLYLLDRSSVSIQCSQMGVFVDFFLTGQETYMLIFAIDLLMALKNPFSASKGHMTKYHIAGGLWSLICAMISHFDTHYALFGFCWMNSSDEHLNSIRTAVAKGSATQETVDAASNGTLTSGIFFALYIVMVYCTSLAAILRAWNTLSKGLPDTFTTRRRIHRHLKYYVGCYFGYWTLVLGCYVLFSLMPRDNSDGTGGVRCRIWHLLKCLLLAKGMVNSLIWTRTSNILTIIEQLREFGYVDLPPHEDSINWALRLEILTKTTAGICAAVDEAEKHARNSTFSSCVGDDTTVNDSNFDADFSSEQRKEMYSHVEKIILEYRNDHRVRGPMSQGIVFKDFAPEVFRRLREEANISSVSYRNSLEQTTKERVSEGKSGAFFYFTEDRKYVVKTLSEEERKFLLSILPLYYTFIKRNPNTFMTRFFGCHGVTMYGKTVYFVVMQSVFDSNLQIHERFDLKGSWVGRLEGRKPSGTIATCKFCNIEYVVGGSHDQLCHVRRGEGNLRHQYDQVGKDLNWNRHMALPFLTARAVAMQLVKDSSFLCRVNCIDYSLLVGIHHRSFNVSHYSSADNFETPPPMLAHPLRASWGSSAGPSQPAAATTGGDRASSSSNGAGASAGSTGFASTPTAKPFHQAIQGGMSVDEVHGPGIYFMGIIDMLQPWNFRKRLEHFVRVYFLMQDRNGISVVNPRQYAERFQQRVVHELIYDGHFELDEIDLMQLQFQPEFLQRSSQRNGNANPLMESGITRSTVVESFDGRFDSTVMLERVSSSYISPPQSTPVIPMRMSTRMAAAGNGRAGVGVPPPHPFGPTAPGITRRSSSQQRQRAATVSTGLPEHYSLGPRLSDGLVMEPPGGFYSPQRNSLGCSSPSVPLSHSSYVFPSYLDAVTAPSYSNNNAQQMRRPLAPVTASPHVLLSRNSLARSDSEASLTHPHYERASSVVLPVHHHHAANAGATTATSNSNNTISNSISNSSSPAAASSSASPMTIQTSVPDSHHLPHHHHHNSYQIVHTPTTFPSDKNPTMSA